MIPPQTDSAITLDDGLARLVIRPDLGAGIAAYDLRVDGQFQEIFRRAPADVGAHFDLACNVLVPWSNRISGGGFTFDGEFFALEPNLASDPFPIHGNGFSAAWQVTRHDSNRLVLELGSEGPGPYRYDGSVEYALEQGALNVRLQLRNRAARALPYGMGLHPWLPRTARTELLAPAARVWLEDERHLPSGSELVAAVPGWDFSQPRTLPQLWINNGFTGWTGAARIRWPERHLSLDIQASAELSTYIVYSPGQASSFLAFEPVSHPVDAFNLPGGAEANGMTVLRPGEEWTATCRFVPRQDGQPLR